MRTLEVWWRGLSKPSRAWRCAYRHGHGKVWIPRGGPFLRVDRPPHGWNRYDLLSGADVDGDGVADIMGRDSQGQLYFYRGLGGGKFATKVQVGSGWGPSGVSVDCSGDTSTGRPGAGPQRQRRLDTLCGDMSNSLGGRHRALMCTLVAAGTHWRP
jgi:hypothetical protein